MHTEKVVQNACPRSGRYSHIPADQLLNVEHDRNIVITLFRCSLGKIFAWRSLEQALIPVCRDRALHNPGKSVEVQNSGKLAKHTLLSVEPNHD